MRFDVRACLSLPTHGLAAVGLGWLLALAGCRTTPPIPAADLTAPEWTVRQGQAVWTAGPGESGLAGELLVARRPDGATFIQFAKPPFTLVTARAEPGVWSVERHQTGQRMGGRGPAPRQWIWFALAESVAGKEPGSSWVWEQRAAGAWRLAHRGTGEAIEGFLAP